MPRVTTVRVPVPARLHGRGPRAGLRTPGAAPRPRRRHQGGRPQPGPRAGRVAAPPPAAPGASVRSAARQVGMGRLVLPSARGRSWPPPRRGPAAGRRRPRPRPGAPPPVRMTAASSRAACRGVHAGCIRTPTSSAVAPSSSHSAPAVPVGQPAPPLQHPRTAPAPPTTAAASSAVPSTDQQLRERTVVVLRPAGADGTAPAARSVRAVGPAGVGADGSGASAPLSAAVVRVRARRPGQVAPGGRRRWASGRRAPSRASSK